MEQPSVQNLRISSIQSSSPSLKKLNLQSTLMIIAIILMTSMISPHYCWIPLYLRPSSYFSSNAPLNSAENVTNSVNNATINMIQSSSNLVTSKPSLSMPQSTITGYLNNQPTKRPRLPTPKPNPSLNYHYYQHYLPENNTDRQKNNSSHSSHNTNNTWIEENGMVDEEETVDIQQLHSINASPFEIVMQNDKTMAHIIFDKYGQNITHCELFDLVREPLLPRLLLMADKKSVLVDHKTILEAIRRCTQLALDRYYKNYVPGLASNNNQTKIESVRDLWKPIDNENANETSLEESGMMSYMGSFADINNLWHGIVPGTKWCGPGDIAESYDDLSSRTDIDICCRAHDHCPTRIKGFRYDYGIWNFSFYSRLHCDCDEDFYRCLKLSPNTYASLLGTFYFNMLRIYCLKEDIPKSSSAENSSFENSDAKLLNITQHRVCLRRRRTSLGKYECSEYGMIPYTQMKLILFGRKF